MNEMAIQYNLTALDAEDLTGEHIYELVKHWQSTHDLVVDGWAGPVTRSSIEALWDDAEELVPITEWEEFTGPLAKLPDTRREVYEIFGNPGSGSPDRAWERANLCECHPRYGNQLPGVPERFYVTVHKLAEPYLREALRRAMTVSDYTIERLGCYVFRHQRHDPKRPLSDHSWGIAVDINPSDNFSKRIPEGTCDPWSGGWMKIWPKGVPREFVDAFKSVGWSWGGDWPNFRDPMHLSLKG